MYFFLVSIPLDVAPEQRPTLLCAARFFLLVSPLFVEHMGWRHDQRALRNKRHMQRDNRQPRRDGQQLRRNDRLFLAWELEPFLIWSDISFPFIPISFLSVSFYSQRMKFIWAFYLIFLCIFQFFCEFSSLEYLICFLDVRMGFFGRSSERVPDVVRRACTQHSIFFWIGATILDVVRSACANVCLQNLKKRKIFKHQTIYLRCEADK